MKYTIAVNHHEYAKGLYDSYDEALKVAAKMARDDDGYYHVMEIEADVASVKKVPVPKNVAKWIDYLQSYDVKIESVVACYRNYRDHRDSGESWSDDDGDLAVRWLLDNPYKFIRAFVEGYEVSKNESN